MNLPAAISVAAAVVGLAVAGLALGLGSSPRWARYRVLAVTALFASAYCALGVVATLDMRPDLVIFLTRVQNSVAALHVVTWLIYTDLQLPRMIPRWQTLTRSAVVVTGTGWLIPGLFLDEETARFTVKALGVTYQYATVTTLGALVFMVEVGCLAVGFVRFTRAARSGVEGAHGHAAAVGIWLTAAAHDTLVTVGVIRGPFLLPLSFIGCVAALGALLTRAFVADARQLDLMTQRLEQLVDERTKALVATESALVRAEKMAALGQLCAGVAHEINNPAAAVMGNLEYLRDEVGNGGPGEESLTCIDDSLDAIDRIAKIVRQLLDVGRAAATARVSDVTSVSRAAHQALRSVGGTVQSTVIVETDVSDELLVCGDEGSLVQVLVNLVSNARQAIDRSSGGRIFLGAAQEGDEVVISVTDNGAGMTEETKRRLFEPFYTTKPFGKGTGLGLSLSLGIVRSLGGDITVDSCPGETTMRVRLPVAAAPPSPPSSGRIRARERRRSRLVADEAGARSG